MKRTDAASLSLREIVDAIRVIERMGICSIDYDVPSQKEHDAIKRLVVALQEANDNYQDDAYDYELGPSRVADELDRGLADVLARLPPEGETKHVSAIVSEMLGIYGVRFTDENSRQVAIDSWTQQLVHAAPRPAETRWQPIEPRCSCGTVLSCPVCQADMYPERD